jgi:drug/metabolite transporter (DMT)-like permease
MLAATPIFACMDTASKHLMTRYNVPMVAAIRYAVSLMVLVVLMAPRHGTELWKTRRSGLVLLRSLSLAVATLFAGMALQRMPVAETTAIIYLQPLGVMLLAGRFLNERVGLAGWMAVAAGFVGVLLITRPGSGLSTAGVIFAVSCAVISVNYQLLSRILAKTETTMAMLLYVAGVGFIFFGAMLPWYWTGPAFTALDIVLLLFIGSASLAGHFLFTAAFRLAPASRLAPFNYAHLVFAVILGWLVFQHVPDRWAFAGMALIICGGIGSALRSHFTKPVTQEV